MRRTFLGVGLWADSRTLVIPLTVTVVLLLGISLSGSSHSSAAAPEHPSRRLVAPADVPGRVVDQAAGHAVRREAPDDRHGAVSTVLKSQLEEAAPDDRLPVLIWLDDGGRIPSVPRPLPGSSRGIVAQAEGTQVRGRREARLALSEIQAPVRARIGALGGGVTAASRYAPLIAAWLPSKAVEALAERADVRTIDLDRPLALQMDVVAPTVRVGAVWSQGITGTASVTVAVVERGTVYPNANHVDVAAYYNASYCNYNQGGQCADSHDHATGVAGVIAAHSSPGGASPWQGIAPGVRLISANTDAESFGETMNATEWALEQGARIINFSQGVHDNAPPYAPSSIDAYYDYLVRHHSVTVVAAAGNAGSGCDDTQDGQITSPARGFNVITVGGFDDGGTGTWSDDSVNPCSSFLDPDSSHGDREEPDVVAPGKGIETLAWNDVWQTVDGTSFAAPIVSGGVALLMERELLLTEWPEAVRAILMASAVHNIEGESRLSEKDGAGGVDLYMADTVVKNGWWTAEYLSPASFDAGSYEIPATVEAGERVRVAIAWDSNPSGDYSDDPLQADLDLAVYGPDGTFIPGASSSSWDNSYEIVEFEATQTGEHAIRIHSTRFDGDVEPVGVAWARVVPPEITSLSVTSDKPGYFYSSGLSSEGGTVTFNSNAGQGAGQTLTVDATWSAGTAPRYGFDGSAAFGDDPVVDSDVADGWTQQYTVEAGATTESSVPLVVSNQLSPPQQAVSYVTFRADNVAGAPPLSSSSHPDQNSWYSENDVSLDWSGLSDVSGIVGYSYALDHAASTVPDMSVDTTNTTVDYDGLADGEWTFHVRALDRVGNWSPAAHYRVRIDTAAPGVPTISSDTHPDQNLWYGDGDVTLDWTTPGDATGGVAGYSFVLDQTASTVPDTSVDTTYNCHTYPAQSDGEWTFHVRPVDHAGNWGAADHYRVRIDTAAPPAPTVSSSSHPVEGTCYPEGAPAFSWTVPDDVSGIVGYSYTFDSNGTTTPDTEAETSGNNASYTSVADGDWYFHVRAKDGAGTWGATAHYHICIDAPLVGPLVYDTHIIDDDGSGESVGNGNTVVDCGETIELTIDLRNQGTDAAEGVSVVISESDPYVALTQNTSSDYPDIPGGTSQSNADDFEFTVASGTPDEHVIPFDLSVSASNGGPWADSLEVAVSCERPDLTVMDIVVPPDPIAGQSVDFTVDVHNQGDSSTAPWGPFTVACYLDGSSTSFDTDTVSGLDAGASASAQCRWTATEGSHTVRVVIDSDGDVPELDEGNNERGETIAVGATCNDPHEPNDGTGDATALAYGTTLTDPDICPAGDADVYAFAGSGGDVMVAEIEAASIGSALDSNLYLYGTDGVTIIAQNDDAEGTDSRITHVLPEDGTFTLVVLDANHPNEGGPGYFYHLSLVLDEIDVGPIETHTYTVDDDGLDQSSGNGDGVVNCGETVELTVNLRNQGSETAQDVYAEISEDDPYVDLLYNTSSQYADIPGGGWRGNSNDFDLRVDPTTPHGHVIHFELDVTASNDGPWSDSLDVAVSCGNDAPNAPSSPAPADGVGGEDVVTTLAWSGGDPDGDAVTYDVYLEATDATPDELVCSDVPTPSCAPDTLAWDTRYDWTVVATDVHGASATGPHWQFFTAPPPIGPLVYVSHRIVDDGSGYSEGNGDGVLNCGETVEIYSTLRNTGGDTATGVGVDAWSNSSYAAPIYTTSAYPDIPGGESRENEPYAPLVYGIRSDTPDGHLVEFDLDIAASSGGPWSDSFESQVVCPRPDLVVRGVAADPSEARDGESVDFAVEVANQGNGAVASGDGFDVACHLEGSGSPFDSQSVSGGLAVDASTVVTCAWTAVEGAHVVTATVDAGDVITETDESNNTGTQAFLVGEGCGDPYEPNDDWGQAERLDLGERLSGATVCPEGDEDVYQLISGLAGTTIRADIDAEAIGSPLDAELAFYDMDMAHQLAYSNDSDGLDPQITYRLPEDGIYYIRVRAADHPQEGGIESFYEIALDAAAQLEVQGYIVDDGGLGASSGNGDGVIQCGETVELTVLLRNESSRDAPDVSATLSTTSTDVSLVSPVQRYPDIAGWETVSNTKPFVLQVDGGTPDGHAVPLELALQAADGLIRYDALRLPVSCPCRARLGSTDYGTVQAAIDASTDASDVVRVTGRCTEHDVVIDRNLTVQGGWNSDFTIRDPGVYRTFLDAQGLGRVLIVTGGSPVVETVRLVDGNTSEKGGGVFVSDGEPVLRNNEIMSNTSGSGGGGVYLGGDDATLIGNTISNNTVTGLDGGGIAIGNFSAATLESNTITGNSAYRNAGGVTVGYDSDVTLVNNIIAGNVCGTSAWSVGGAGIWLSHGDHLLVHNTFASNRGGDGAGIRLSGDASLTNTIIASHTVGLVVVGDPSVATLEGTLWYNNVQDTSGDGTTVIGVADLHGDPRFVNPAADDYHIAAGSAALDVGLDVGVADDIDGDRRPSDGDGDGVGEVDIGADEHYPLCITPLAGLKVTGPVTGVVDTLYTFTAGPTPFDATRPVTYDWSPEPDIGGGATASYRWENAGTKEITVTGWGCGGSGVAAHTIVIEAGPGGERYLFLPLILRGY